MFFIEQSILLFCRVNFLTIFMPAQILLHVFFDYLSLYLNLSLNFWSLLRIGSRTASSKIIFFASAHVLVADTIFSVQSNFSDALSSFGVSVDKLARLTACYLGWRQNY